MEADTESVRTRSYVGNYRTIPWSVIVDVQFPSNTRFARLVLPGDETLALYAVAASRPRTGGRDHARTAGPPRRDPRPGLSRRPTS